MPAVPTGCRLCGSALPECWERYAESGASCCATCAHENVPKSPVLADVRPGDPPCRWCRGSARICAAWDFWRAMRCCSGCDHRPMTSVSADRKSK